MADSGQVFSLMYSGGAWTLPEYAIEVESDSVSDVESEPSVFGGFNDSIVEYGSAESAEPLIDSRRLATPLAQVNAHLHAV